MTNNEIQKNIDDKKNKERQEETTKYGEWVSSYFSWITPKEQKKKAEELENMTKKSEK